MQEQMNSNITYRLDGLSMQTSINLSKDLLDKIDLARGTQSRSAFIVGIVNEHISGGDVDKKRIIQQLEADRVTQGMQQSEIDFLRAEVSRLTDAVAVKLLSEPKKSFWSRFRRS